MEQRDFPDEDPYHLLGRALIHAQSVESMMRFCTTYVLQKEGPLTLEKLHSLNQSERKKTLGYFLDQVRRRAKLDPDLSEKLNTYLDMRNDIVHDLSRVSCWGLSSGEGTSASCKYLWSFIERGFELLNIFAALVLEWGIQQGYTTTDKLPDLIRNDVLRYSSSINSLFSLSDKK